MRLKTLLRHIRRWQITFVFCQYNIRVIEVYVDAGQLLSTVV